MKVVPTAIADVLLFEPTIYRDARGFVFESFNQRQFDEATGRKTAFVQDNHSQSGKHVLRGLHYQIRHAQGKLVRVVSGEVFDVAVDLRRGSPTFGKVVAEVLSAANHRQLWVPPGFAHGFFVLSDGADVLYKVTDDYSPTDERCIIWDDPDIGVPWPRGIEPVLSAKDRLGLPLSKAEIYG